MNTISLMSGVSKTLLIQVKSVVYPLSSCTNDKKGTVSDELEIPFEGIFDYRKISAPIPNKASPFGVFCYCYSISCSLYVLAHRLISVINVLI
jgi:hypothetical protein